MALDDNNLQQWLETIYDNQVLTISLGETGSPSSSSEPVLMAQMLAALDIQPGMHILEIGTGTGYNAALLAHLVGETGRVASIDIQPMLIQQAREAITALVINNVTLYTGNGLLGVPGQAPYDRIIATASHTRVPYTWIAQLHDGGQLLMNLGSHGGLIFLQKSAHTVSGRFLEQRGFFMPLVETYQDADIQIDHIDFESLQSMDFYFFAGWLMPKVVIHPISLFSKETASTEPALRFRSQDGTQSVLLQAVGQQVKVIKQAKEKFARQVLDGIYKWHEWGQPTLSSFRFEMDSNGRQIISFDVHELVQL